MFFSHGFSPPVVPVVAVVAVVTVVVVVAVVVLDLIVVVIKLLPGKQQFVEFLRDFCKTNHDIRE